MRSLFRSPLVVVGKGLKLIPNCLVSHGESRDVPQNSDAHAPVACGMGQVLRSLVRSFPFERGGADPFPPPKIQLSTCSAIASASSTSIPCYRTTPHRRRTSQFRWRFLRRDDAEVREHEHAILTEAKLAEDLTRVLAEPRRRPVHRAVPESLTLARSGLSDRALERRIPEAFAQRLPFVGADACEASLDVHVAGRHGMPSFCLKVR